MSDIQIEIDTLKSAKEVLEETFGKEAEGAKYYEDTISALEELQQYRAIGTLDECREARERITQRRV